MAKLGFSTFDTDWCVSSTRIQKRRVKKTVAMKEKRKQRKVVWVQDKKCIAL